MRTATAEVQQCVQQLQKFSNAHSNNRSTATTEVQQQPKYSNAHSNNRSTATTEVQQCAQQMQKYNKHIGIFDSGRGGQFVANWLEQLEPTWQFHVVNDSQNVPYGDKSADEIITLTETAIRPLLNHCDVVVIACNTATALAIDTLRQLHPRTKFVGFEPMIKPASQVAELTTSTGKIAVLATPATLNSKRYQELKTKWASNFQVFEPDCSQWARKIEDEQFSVTDFSEVLTLIEQQQIDQVILACTHYLGVQQLLEQQIAEKISNSVRILQPMHAIHRQITRLVELHD
jgi:glutamate racemase